MGRCPALKLGAPGRPSLETVCWPRVESLRFGCRSRDCRPDPTNPTDPRHQAPETLAATEQLTRGVKSGGLGLEAGGPQAGRRPDIWGPAPCQEKRALLSPRSGAPQARGHRARGPAPRPPVPEAPPHARQSPRPRPHALNSPRPRPTPRPHASQTPRPRPQGSLRTRNPPSCGRGASQTSRLWGCPPGAVRVGGASEHPRVCSPLPSPGDRPLEPRAGLGAGPPGLEWPPARCELGPPGSRGQDGPWDSVTRPAHVEGPSHVILPGQSCQRQGA